MIFPEAPNFLYLWVICTLNYESLQNYKQMLFRKTALGLHLSFPQQG